MEVESTYRFMEATGCPGIGDGSVTEELLHIVITAYFEGGRGHPAPYGPRNRWKIVSWDATTRQGSKLSCLLKTAERALLYF